MPIIEALLEALPPTNMAAYPLLMALAVLFIVGTVVWLVGTVIHLETKDEYDKAINPNPKKERP